METASFVASIVSCITGLVVGILAIALSIYFYTQNKNVEAAFQTALEGIRVQTDSLQKLTGRWMDRLTKYVTTPQSPRIESQNQLLNAIKDLPKDIASQLPVPGQSSQEKELLSAYCALYYYTAVANYWAQFMLPPLDEFDRNREYAQHVKETVDRSCSDFYTMAGILSKIDPTLLSSVPLKSLADKAAAEYQGVVRDSTSVYAWRTEQVSPTSSGQ
jgi:hypothetical protein